MPPPLAVHHFGVLVANLEEAIHRWSAATGYTFSPISRYRTDRYVDSSGTKPHFHDARISFSKEGPPYIELMEFTGTGTHSPSQGEGFHHLGFMDVPDVESCMADLAAIGIGHDGQSMVEDGRMHLWFTDKKDLNGMRLEYVSSTLPAPLVGDAGDPPFRDPAGMPTLWPPE